MKVGLFIPCYIDAFFPAVGAARDILGKVWGLERVEIDRRDECCGFGGRFCVTDEAVSAKMGWDRTISVGG